MNLSSMYNFAYNKRLQRKVFFQSLIRMFLILKWALFFSFQIVKKKKKKHKEAACHVFSHFFPHEGAVSF